MGKIEKKGQKEKQKTIFGQSKYNNRGAGYKEKWEKRKILFWLKKKNAIYLSYQILLFFFTRTIKH